MNADQGSPGTDNAAERGKGGPDSRPMGIRQALREIRKGIVVMWWSFFDWLAVISWKALLLVAFLGLVLGAILKRPTLGQQVNLCSAFLEIMAVRMEGRLQPVVSVPEGLKSAVFPSMMLQTLVENAIKHGLEPKAEGGRLEIRAEIDDGQLAVHVLDSGIGFIPQAEIGVGLANVRERLKALYQDRAELIIGVPAAGGTCATIKVPYETVAASTS